MAEEALETLRRRNRELQEQVRLQDENARMQQRLAALQTPRGVPTGVVYGAMPTAASPLSLSGRYIATPPAATSAPPLASSGCAYPAATTAAPAAAAAAAGYGALPAASEDPETRELRRMLAALQQELLAPVVPVVPVPVPAVAPVSLPAASPAAQLPVSEELQRLREQVRKQQEINRLQAEVKKLQDAQAQPVAASAPAAPAAVAASVAESEKIRSMQEQIDELRKLFESKHIGSPTPAAPPPPSSGRSPSADVASSSVSDPAPGAADVARAEKLRALREEQERLRRELEAKSSRKGDETHNKALDEARKAMAKSLASAPSKRVASLDLVLVLDLTGSMGKWIDQAKDRLLGVVGQVKAAYPDITLRLGFVGYRDHNDGADRLVVKDLSEHTEAVQALVRSQKTKTSSGRDVPEDVAGALKAALGFAWGPGARAIVHAADAPPHGKMYHDPDHDIPDNYPDGDPNGLRIEDLMMQMGRLGVDYTFFRIRSNTDKMIEVMRANYDDPSKLREVVVEKLGDKSELFAERLFKAARDSVERSVRRFAIGFGDWHGHEYKDSLELYRAAKSGLPIDEAES